jgi:hypothetical protein
MIEKIDFPQTYERMITCGSIECMGKRRKERYGKRGVKSGVQKKL